MWKTNRKARLPSDWNTIRLRILRRDKYRCQIAAEGCKRIATEVDHIRRGDNHADDNLQSACSVCHHRKTLTEAQEARRKKRAARFRPIERHPGER